MIDVTRVVSETVKPLWIERREFWRHNYEVESFDPAGDETEMHSGYSVVDGAYCGAIDQSGGLFEFFNEHGIKPQKRRPDSNNCSIGFSEKEQKWYGWSHRAIFGFGVGSEVKRGDCAYTPTDKADFLADSVRFWSSDDHLETTGREDILENEDPDDPSIYAGVTVTWVYSDKVPNEAIRGTASSQFTPYPDEFGRGEWTAETLDDAKQMASDFAESVS